MPSLSPILIWTVGAAIVLSICKAPARDLGQWEGFDLAQREWFDGLMQPDRPNLSCCGEADGYWADSYEVKGDQYVAIFRNHCRRDAIRGRRRTPPGGRSSSRRNSRSDGIPHLGRDAYLCRILRRPGWSIRPALGRAALAAWLERPQSRRC
jgi:hypothetical protein